MIMSVLFLISISLSAQETNFKYGPRFLIGSSNFDTGNLPGDFGKLMISGGAQGVYSFNPYVAIAAEGLLTAKGSRGKTTESNGGPFGGTSTFIEKYQLIYAEIPLLLKISIPFGNLSPKVVAGISNNFMVAAEYSKTYTSGSGSDEEKSIIGLTVFEQALIMGAGFDIKTDQGDYSIDFRLNKGTSTVGTLPGSAPSVINNYYAIGVGAAF